MDSHTFYCFPGLGADARIFAPLEQYGISLIPIPWQDPRPGERLSAYAERIGTLIRDPHPNLLGLSFGAMLAQVIASQRKVQRLVLISTITQREEMPFWMRMAGSIHLDRIIPLKNYAWLEPLQNRNLGVNESDPVLLELVRTYRKEVSPRFLSWSVGEVLRWKSVNAQAESILRIHGTEDKLFPPPASPNMNWIHGGGHLVVYTHARDVAAKLL